MLQAIREAGEEARKDVPEHIRRLITNYKAEASP